MKAFWAMAARAKEQQDEIFEWLLEGYKQLVWIVEGREVDDSEVGEE